MTQDLTTDEIISTLNHSTAPTLILEGKDDYIAFQEFERENVEWGFTILPVKGRDRIIELINRHDEILNPCIFYLMDKDEWALIGVPSQYNAPFIGFTNGASIENDLVIDGNIRNLMNHHEKGKLDGILNDFSEIYLRLAYNHVHNVQDHSIAESIYRFADHNLHRTPEWNLFIARSPNFINEPNGYNPIEHIRGKTILQMFTAILSHANRPSKYSKLNILEIGARQRGINLQRIEQSILSYFELSGCKT